MTFGCTASIVGNVSEEKARRLGEWLRQRREELGIDLDRAEAETRIRARFLQALESEDFEDLPGPVVGRGFLRNYATYLNLDPQEATRLFSEQVAPPEPESLSAEQPSPFTSDPFRPVPLHEMPGRVRSRLWIVGLLVIVAVAVAILVWQGYPTISDWLASHTSAIDPNPRQQATGMVLTTATHTPTTIATTAVPVVASPARETPIPEITLSPTWTPSPAPTSTPSVYTGIFLELVFTDTSWIQVTVDGVRQFQGELPIGTYRSWYGEDRIELRIGNAGAVMATINGQSLGALGNTGEVVERIFEKMGEQVSEASPTPQPSGSVTTEPISTPQPTTASSTPQVTFTPSITTTQLVTPTVTISPTVPITATAGP